MSEQSERASSLFILAVSLSVALPNILFLCLCLLIRQLRSRTELRFPMVICFGNLINLLSNAVFSYFRFQPESAANYTVLQCLMRGDLLGTICGSLISGVSKTALTIERIVAVANPGYYFGKEEISTAFLKGAAGITICLIIGVCGAIFVGIPSGVQLTSRCDIAPLTPKATLVAVMGLVMLLFIVNSIAGLYLSKKLKETGNSSIGQAAKDQTKYHRLAKIAVTDAKYTFILSVLPIVAMLFLMLIPNDAADILTNIFLTVFLLRFSATPISYLKDHPDIKALYAATVTIGPLQFHLHK